MKVKASDLQIQTLKEGMKVTMYIGKHEIQEALEGVHELIGQPLDLSVGIDEVRKNKEITKIDAGTLSTIKEAIRDISNVLGQNEMDMEHKLKRKFLEDSSNGWQFNFSLSNCCQLLAEEFIIWLLDYAIKRDIYIDIPVMPELDVI